MIGATIVGQVSPEVLKGRLETEDEVPVVDVRAEESYEGWHIPGAINLEYNKDRNEFAEDPDGRLPTDKQIVAVCAHGNTSRLAAQRLSELGFDAVTLEEGMLGWSKVFDVVDIDLADELVFKQVKRISNGCLSYVLGHDGEAMVVDPVQYTDVYERNLRADERLFDDEGAVDLTYVAITHIHADHISAGARLAEKYDAELLVGSAAAERTEKPEGYEDPTYVDDGEVVSVGDYDVEVLHTPGHTMESISLRVAGDALLTGDTQFVDSVGRPDLEHGDDGAREHAEVLYDTIFDTVLECGDDVLVFPAHWGSEAAEPGKPIAEPIGEIKRTNDAVQLEEKAAFVEYILDRLGSKPANHDEIIAINEGKREVCDPEIELGPNKCAVD